MPTPAIEPALGLLEVESIAAGIEVGDAMAKRSPIEVIRAGTVHPGKFLILVGGGLFPCKKITNTHCPAFRSTAR